MILGTKVPVIYGADYGGKDMAWTEPYTGELRLKKRTRFLHSSSSPIKAFAPIETCFSTEYVYEDMFKQSNKVDRAKYGAGKPMGKKYCYMLSLPAGSIVETYSHDEIRTELVEGMELVYVGYYQFIFLNNPIVVEKIIDPRQERLIKVITRYYLRDI